MNTDSEMKTKVKIQLIPAIIIVLISGACKSGNSPGKAAERFLNAFNERKYDEARKYASTETIKLVDLMENLSQMSEASDSVNHPKIEIVDERVEGDTAFVTFREKGAEETDEIKLVKTEGKWLVHITKTELSAKDNSLIDTGIQMDEPDSGEAGEAIDDAVAEDTTTQSEAVTK